MKLNNVVHFFLFHALQIESIIEIQDVDFQTRYTKTRSWETLGLYFESVTDRSSVDKLNYILIKLILKSSHLIVVFYIILYEFQRKIRIFNSTGININN